jgi:hypothetical protein
MLSEAQWALLEPLVEVCRREAALTNDSVAPAACVQAYR